MLFIRKEKRANAPCSDSYAYVLHKEDRSTFVFTALGHYYIAQFTPNIQHYLFFPDRYTVQHIVDNAKMTMLRTTPINDHTKQVLNNAYKPICANTRKKLMQVVTRANTYAYAK